MDQAKLKLMLEAERRGILPADKVAILAELRRRGVISGNAQPDPRMAEAAAALPPADTSAAGALTAGVALPKPPPGQSETAARAALQGLTFGGGDEGAAAVSGALAAMGLGPNASVMHDGMADAYQGAYSAKLKEERERLEAGREENPVTAFGAELAGAVASPASVLAAPKIAGATTNAGRIATGAGTGAAGGGLYGFLSGKNGAEDRSQAAVVPAMFGSAVGAAVPAAGAAIRKYLDGRATNKATSKFIESAPSVDELKTEAGRLYSGGSPAPEGAMNGVFGNAAAKLKKLGAMHPDGSIPLEFDKLGSALDTLTKYGDEVMTPEQMQTVRRQIMKVAGAGGTQGEAGRILLREFDAVTEPLHSGIKAGNKVFTRAKKLEDLELADTLAMDAAGANYTRASYETSIRQKMRALLKRVEEGKETRFTSDEIAQMRKIANGGSIENAMRWVSRSAPNSLGSILFQGGVPAMLGSAFGVPGVGVGFGAAAIGAGGLAKSAANRMQSKNVGLLQAMAGTGKTVPAIEKAQPRGLLEFLSMTGAVPAVQ